MSFVQILKIRTSKITEFQALADEWEKATDGKRTVVKSFVCQDRDNPTQYSIVAFFDSYEDAMKNSELAETDALARRMAALSETAPVFENLDVLEERR